MTDYTSTGTHAGKQGNGSTMEGGLTGAAGQAAAGLMAQVKSRASSQVAAQQVRAADGLGTVANALRKAGNELRSHNEGLASYADMAVDELEHISSRIREKSPGEYIDDIEQFARSRPAAFVGGTFLLGLALARFLKSTQPRHARAYARYDSERGGRGYDEPYRSPQAPSRTSGMTGRWPESTGSVTPPSPPGRTPAPASSASSATERTASQATAGSSSSTGASSSSAPQASNRNRGTGERP